MESRHIIERFWSSVEAKDLAAMTAMIHPDIRMEWPQSGERFTGIDNGVAAMTATEEKPEVAGLPRIVGSGAVWTVTLPLRYGEEIYHYVGIFELEGELIRRTTEFFAAPFPANPARAPYTDTKAGVEDPT